MDVSGRRPSPFDSSLCRHTFADGRQCRLPAHPDFDGLCYQHGTFRPRASRIDNFLRALEPVCQGSVRPIDLRRASAAMARACAEQRISPEQFRALQQLSNLLRQTERPAREEGFVCQGSAWDAIRKLIDHEDS